MNQRMTATPDLSDALEFYDGLFELAENALRDGVKIPHALAVLREDYKVGVVPAPFSQAELITEMQRMAALPLALAVAALAEGRAARIPLDVGDAEIERRRAAGPEAWGTDLFEALVIQILARGRFAMALCPFDRDARTIERGELRWLPEGILPDGRLDPAVALGALH